LSVEDHTISFSLEVNVEDACREFRRLLAVAYRWMAIAERLGLPEDVQRQIQSLQNLIRVLNSARLAIRAFEMASGPIGWAMAAASVVSAAFTFGDMLDYELRGRV